MKKKGIVLIGMPSSGKSTVGKLLAQKLKMDYVDTDSVIREKENRELKEIVNTDGLQRFLEIQEEAIVGLDMDGHVVSTGGSVVYCEEAMAYLKRGGIVVYLDTQYRDIEKRIAAGRRFARREDQSLLDIYNERVPLYREYADIIVDCSGKNAEDVAEEVIKLIVEKKFEGDAV